MARIARVIAPGIPHHITQRGNRRQQTFFCNDDYTSSLDLMAELLPELSNNRNNSAHTHLTAQDDKLV